MKMKAKMKAEVEMKAEVPRLVECFRDSAGGSRWEALHPERQKLHRALNGRLGGGHSGTTTEATEGPGSSQVGGGALSKEQIGKGPSGSLSSVAFFRRSLRGTAALVARKQKGRELIL